MKKLSIVVGAAMIFSSLAFSSQEEQPEPKYGKSPQFKNYFGVAAGFTTGYGISYRRWLSDKWGLQANFAPYYKTSKNPNTLNYWGYSDFYTSAAYPLNSTIDSGTFQIGSVSFGLTGIRTIAEGRFFRAILYTGLNVLSNYENSEYYYSKYDYSTARTIRGSDTYYEFNNKLTLGGGGGFEIYAWRFSFNLLTGLRGGINLPDKTPEFLPSIEGGIHFMF